MSPAASLPADIFDRRRRQLRRDRMAKQNHTAFIANLIGEQIIERLGDISRDFNSILVIGAHLPDVIQAAQARCAHIVLVDAGFLFAQRMSGIQSDEDRLLLSTLATQTFDAILWPGGLESINDVPGALIQCRRLLHPDGVLLGALLGAGSLPALREAVATVDGDKAVARFHPQIDVRAIGDLLLRCGFSLPVADSETIAIRYSRIATLIDDLRSAGLTNILAGPVHRFTRRQWRALQSAYARDAAADAPDSGKTTERFVILHFTAWAPHPSQPQPARRGSATRSLATELDHDPEASPENAPPRR